MAGWPFVATVRAEYVRRMADTVAVVAWGVRGADRGRAANPNGGRRAVRRFAARADRARRVQRLDLRHDDLELFDRDRVGDVRHVADRLDRAFVRATNISCCDTNGVSLTGRRNISVPPTAVKLASARRALSRWCEIEERHGARDRGAARRETEERHGFAEPLPNAWGALGAPHFNLVPKGGLEPPRVAPHAPQTCASASSATSARAGMRREVYR